MNKNPLPPNLLVARADGGMLLRNLAMFSSLLRRAGFGGGAQKTAAAAEALSYTGVEKRADVFWALAAVYVEKREQFAIFRRAFNIFWRGANGEEEENAPPEIVAPFSVPQNGGAATPQENAAAEYAKMRAGDREHLAKKDFARMSEEEWRAAMRINRTLAAALPPPPSRRKTAAIRGAPDMRRTIRRALARGGDIAEFRHSRAGEKPAELIVLTDISGSMGVYSRAFLHFVAGMYAGGGKLRMRAFLLGTRLTAVRVRGGDARTAAESVAAAARDWDGGTRLTPLLREFNRVWLRRINAASAVVLFVTDGLEVNFDDSAFSAEVERLQKSCRKLVWLNPLLRYDRYAPLARGAKILARYADEIRPVHNIRAVIQLTDEVLTARFTKRGRVAAF
ncbi:MAG: vWA domain-containing protein [Gammaproteobacteria bacterium]